MNVGSLLESEKQYGSATSYTFKGSPEQLNLHVGDNNLSVKYGYDALPGFPFQFTSMQKEQSEAVQTRSAMHQQIMKDMNRTRVSSVNITPDSVRFVVLHPPTGASRITLNGKDISSLVQSESRTEAGAFSTAAYSVGGAPKDLNLRVGANVANISYATKESVDFDFTCTETQYHQAELRHRTQYNSR